MEISVYTDCCSKKVLMATIGKTIILRRKNIVLDCKSILVKRFAVGLSGAQIDGDLLTRRSERMGRYAF